MCGLTDDRAQSAELIQKSLAMYGSQSAGRLQATAAGNPQQITADNIGFGSAANALFGGAVY